MRHPLLRLSPALLLLVLACAAPGRRAPQDTGPISFPVLPVRARVETAEKAGFCAGEHLPKWLNWRAFNWVERSTHTVWPREVRVVCSQSKPLTFALEVFAWPEGTSVARVQQRFDEDSDAEHNARAHVFAHGLAKNKKVIAAGLEAYFNNQFEVAELGAEAWLKGRWKEAVRALFMSLESDIAAPGRSALNLGLSQSFAGLDRPLQAFWYLRAFQSEGGDLDKAKWDYFKGKAEEIQRAMMAWDQEESVRLKAVAEEARSLALEKRHHASVLRYKDLFAESPWAAEYADLLSKTYRVIGWKRLAAHWEGRAQAARRLSRDRAGFEKLLERLR